MTTDSKKDRVRWFVTPRGQAVSFRVPGQKWKKLVGFERRPRYSGYFVVRPTAGAEAIYMGGGALPKDA